MRRTQGWPLRLPSSIALAAMLCGVLSAEARNFRPSRVPNGTVHNCATCHSSGNGGDDRNPFGDAVESLIGGTSADIAFWGAVLAGQDSDGDGFTNGQELGDPSGSWPNQSPRPGATNPGDPNSRPRSPAFSSSPVTSAGVGLAYSYQAAATEPSGLPVVYGKGAGPDWLSVSSSGLVSGTPTASGTVNVSIAVFVVGLTSVSSFQSYTLNIAAANNPPVFTSIPVTAATIGQPYSYQATASDPDGNALTFSVFAGPEWLSVSTSGLASGTPPAGSAGPAQVFLRVLDNGAPQQFAFQGYTLLVSEASASFAAWQSQNFTLPADIAIAGQGDDPDLDGLPNLLEYALKTPPRQATAKKLMTAHGFNGNGQLEFSEVFRDDDPKLSVKFEAVGTLPFDAPAVINAVITDLTPGDGLKTWTFTDPVARNNTARRFGRLKFESLP